MNKESNFSQEIVLPSQGYLNPEIPGGKVVQRCMMVSDQKFLSGSNQSASVSLNQLIKRTITSPEEFDVAKLSIPDTLYLLFKLRVLSYGKDYRFRTKCPECGRRIDVVVDLAEIPITLLEDNYQDSLEIVLPNRGDKVYTKILRNDDFDAVSDEIKRRKKRNKDDESEYVLRIVQAIEKIKLIEESKELTHPIDIERYVSSLTDLDASAIIAARDNVNFGIIPTLDYICPECREEIEVNLQFSGDFFRPYTNR